MNFNQRLGFMKQSLEIDNDHEVVEIINSKSNFEELMNCYSDKTFIQKFFEIKETEDDTRND